MLKKTCGTGWDWLPTRCARGECRPSGRRRSVEVHVERVARDVNFEIVELAHRRNGRHVLDERHNDNCVITATQVDADDSLQSLRIPGKIQVALAAPDAAHGGCRLEHQNSKWSADDWLVIHVVAFLLVERKVRSSYRATSARTETLSEGIIIL